MLVNKNILIISPQSWGKIKVSKHHYAIELAQRGNSVYFLNPFSRTRGTKLTIEPIEETQNLFLINGQISVPYFTKFKLKWLYQHAVHLTVQRILKKIKQPLDIVWDFDATNIFKDLGIFKAKKTILHPVDNSTAADFCDKKNVTVGFSLAPIILEHLKAHNIPSHFINHGLTNYIVEKATNRLNHIKAKSSENRKIKVGYIGNLIISSLDQVTFTKIIQENSSVDFHFIGPYTIKNNNIGGYGILENEIREWIEFLQQVRNVTLYGRKSPTEFFEIIKDFDAFVLCYDLKKDVNAGQNSHKILEYLSTGKLVISNRIGLYSKYNDLILMPNDSDNSKLLALFEKGINDIQKYNTPNLQRKRIELALENSYKKQIERIEGVLYSVENSF